MRFHTRKLIMPGDLNQNGTLFGGRLLAWIDEEAALYAIVQLENSNIVTAFISEIEFASSAESGDVIEIGIEPVKFGRTSLVLKCEVRNMMTRQTICSVENITFVNIKDGKPFPHGKTQIEYVEDRLASKGSY